jgi:uncharacterized repeat protein (TIGR01451 family)
MKNTIRKTAQIIFCLLICLLAASANGQTRNGRLWVYSKTGMPYLQVYDRATQTQLLAQFDAGNSYSTPCIPKYGGGVAYDASDGNLWISVTSDCGGDGLIHKIPAMGGPDIKTIPDPTRAWGYSFLLGIGAMDYDPEENVLYAISYKQKGDGTGNWIFKLNPDNGAVITSFPLPYPHYQNETYSLAVARPDSLSGRKVLFIDPYNGALDAETGGSVSWGGATGWQGIDYDEVTGEEVYYTRLDSGDISLEDGYRCDCATIPRPLTQTVSSNWDDPDNTLTWTMQVEVSDNDGLVLRDVKLGKSPNERYMAEKISVPYYKLQTNAFSTPRAELKPDGSSDTSASSHLIDYQVIRDDQKLVIQATYLIDKIPSTTFPNPPSCLHITQRYEFYKRVPGDACEPSATLPCARWKPIIKYRFFGQNADSLTSVNVPQRFHFRVNGFQDNSVGLFRDCEIPLLCALNGGGLLFRSKVNPLSDEHGAQVIRDGDDAGAWDNFHQTFNNSIDEPFFNPGCPECVHFHWRWGAINGASFGDGKVLIVPGSKQDVDIAVVAFRSSEEDPTDYHDLFVNPEPIRELAYASEYFYDSRPQDVVFWYSSTGKNQPADVFSPTKGAFFNPSYKGVVASISEGTSPGSPAASSGTKANASFYIDSPSQDVPESIVFGDWYSDGATTFTADPNTVGPLPNGYVIYDGDSYDVMTDATVSGSHTITFHVPSVGDQTVFNSLRILHVEPDSLDPTKATLIDRTILSPDAPAPDFANRRISAKADGLSTFLIATFSPPPPNNDVADLAVSISHAPSTLSAGSNLTYTVNVTNNGPQTAHTVILKDSLAPEASFVSVSSSAGTCHELNGSVLCSFDSLASGAGATITIVSTPTDGGSPFPPEGKILNNLAVIKATEGDTNLANNSISDSITVLPNPNAAPVVSITSPSTGSSFIGPANVAITATANDSDGISAVDFYSEDDLLGSGTSTGQNQYTFNWNVSFGSHTLIAKATDTTGRETVSTAVNIFVNGLASVGISSPTNGQVFNRPANIVMSATATYSGGTISKVDFYANGALIGSGANAGGDQYSFTWNNAPSGSYTLGAVATDNTGVVTSSMPVTITVNDYPNISLTTPTDGTVFTAPANINFLARATDIDGNVSKVTFFANGVQIGSRAPAGAYDYAFTWNSIAAGTYVLTAVATDNLGASTTSTPINVIVNAPPTVSVTSPTEGSQYTTPTNIVMSSTASDTDGSISRVDFYANGSLIGTGTSGGQNQYSFTWTNPAIGNYALSAIATDNRGATSTSGSTNVKVLSPALFVTGSTTLNSSDSALKARLEALNYVVTVKDGSSAATADATGKAVVVISSTVSPNSVGTKFRTVTVPVVTWESGIFNNMGMTGSTNKDSGTVTRQTQVQITNATHALAAGLSGTVTVMSTSSTMDWGKPNANAAAVAIVVGDTTKTLIFGYESGTAMPGLTAPARRVGLFMYDTTAVSFTTNGQALFDAAIKWATGRT